MDTKRRKLLECFQSCCEENGDYSDVDSGQFDYEDGNTVDDGGALDDELDDTTVDSGQFDYEDGNTVDDGGALDDEWVNAKLPQEQIDAYNNTLLIDNPDWFVEQSHSVKNKIITTDWDSQYYINDDGYIVWVDEQGSPLFDNPTLHESDIKKKASVGVDTSGNPIYLDEKGSFYTKPDGSTPVPFKPTAPTDTVVAYTPEGDPVYITAPVDGSVGYYTKPTEQTREAWPKSGTRPQSNPNEIGHAKLPEVTHTQLQTEKPLKELFPYETASVPLKNEFPINPEKGGSGFVHAQLPVATPPPPPPTPVVQQYHPEHGAPGIPPQGATVRAITAFVNSKGYRHDPDGIPWVTNWPVWDGTTTYNPCVLSKAQLMAGIFPPPGGVNTMRGIRELFYQKNPFADNQNPTVPEIENWNIEVIRHFRRLLGFSEITHPVRNDKCMYLRAAWSNERAYSDYWDTSYPGTLDSATGPCNFVYTGTGAPVWPANDHCGGLFIPSATDQQPYLDPGMSACTAVDSAEGLSNHNTDIPWAIKMSRIIGMFLSSDGIGGHTGPFVGRPNFGSAWFIHPNNPNNMVVRTKWSGPLVPTCP